MKYTIHGLQQQGLIDLGLNHTDALLLRFFLDFKAESRMKEIIVEGETFYWLSFKNIEDQIPIIKNDSVSISRKFRRYEELGLIKKIVKNTPFGKRSYLNTTPFFNKKLSEYHKNSHGDKKDHGSKTEINLQSHGDKKDHAHGDKKDHAIYNSSISDSSITSFKKINKKEIVYEEIKKPKKKRKPSYKTEVQNQIKQTFIDEVKILYPKDKTTRVGFKKLNKFYDNFIMKQNLHSKEISDKLDRFYDKQTKKEFHSKEYFIRNLKACLELKQNYMYSLENYVGANSEKSKNYYREDFIEKLKESKKKTNSSNRRNPQHHYCEKSNAAEDLKSEMDKAKDLWDNFGIRTPGRIIMSPPKNFKGEITDLKQ